MQQEKHKQDSDAQKNESGALHNIQNIGREQAGERGDISHIDQQEGNMNNGALGGAFDQKEENEERKEAR